MKRWLIILVLLLCQISLAEEYRALWVTRFELTTTEHVREVVQTAARHKFNALFVQVCGRGTAFYNSAILPRDDRATDFDALAVCIDEAKKYNIEVHAWVNVLYVWSDKTKPVAIDHVINRHPDWIMANRDKQVSTNDVYLDPARPLVRDYIRSIFAEIVNNYEVAGVHLDYIRYPGPDYGFSEYARRDFEQQQGIDPLALVNNKAVAIKIYGQNDYAMYLDRWAQYRQAAVTTLVADIYATTLKIRPAVKVSAAVIGDYAAAESRYFQVWQDWLTAGTIDMIIPMIYDVNNEAVEKQIVFAATAAEKADRQVLVGLGAWRRGPDEIIKNMQFVQKINKQLGYSRLVGSVLFSYDGISTQPGYLKQIETFFDVSEKVPALPYNKRAFAIENNSKKEDQEKPKLEEYNIIG